MFRPRCWIVSGLLGLSLLLGACDLPGLAPPSGAPLAGTPPARPAGGTPGPVTLHILTDRADSVGRALDQQAAAEYTRQTGINIILLAGPASTTDRLAKTRLHLAAQAPDIDIYQIDVIWP